MIPIYLQASRTRSFSTFSRVISDNAKKVLQFSNVNISSDFSRGSVEYCLWCKTFHPIIQTFLAILWLGFVNFGKYIFLCLITNGNNQHESPDYQNKVSDFNPRSDYNKLEKQIRDDVFLELECEKTFATNAFYYAPFIG